MDSSNSCFVQFKWCLHLAHLTYYKGASWHLRVKRIKIRRTDPGGTAMLEAKWGDWPCKKRVTRYYFSTKTKYFGPVYSVLGDLFLRFRMRVRFVVARFFICCQIYNDIGHPCVYYNLKCLHKNLQPETSLVRTPSDIFD
jgi:hypothetical protein